MSVARKKAAQARRDGDADNVNPDDALVLLTAEHNEIEKMIREFDRHSRTMESVEKGKLALRISDRPAKSSRLLRTSALCASKPRPALPRCAICPR